MTPLDLAAANLFYRRPDLYDQIQADPNHTVARHVEKATAKHAPNARTLLDFGCGTGRDLEYLNDRFECVGVELQPRMADYAARVRPHLDVRVADMRDFDLGRTVDVITCLGNSLAYIHADHDLTAVFATFARHARPGTLLVMSTLTTPVRTEPRTHRIDTADLHADVTISYDWDEHASINTMRRTWHFDEGITHEDHIPRRIVHEHELQQWTSQFGFRPISNDHLRVWINQGT